MLRALVRFARLVGAEFLLASPHKRQHHRTVEQPPAVAALQAAISGCVIDLVSVDSAQPRVCAMPSLTPPHRSSSETFGWAPWGGWCHSCGPGCPPSMTHRPPWHRSRISPGHGTSQRLMTHPPNPSVRGRAGSSTTRLLPAGSIRGGHGGDARAATSATHSTSPLGARQTTGTRGRS